MVDTQLVTKAFSIEKSTALRLIDDFIKLEILQELTGYKRNRIFGFGKYIKLFK